MKQMIVTLMALLSVRGASVLIDPKQAAKLSCYLITSWTIFDLRALQNTVQDYNSGNLTWNFCQFTQWPTGQLIRKADTFAYMMNETNGFATPITTGALVPQVMKLNKDNYGN